MVSCASPVPGGKSTTKTSSSPHSTFLMNSVSSLSIIGPRQTTACPSGTRNPIDMTLRSYFVIGMSRLSSVLGGRSWITSMRGTLGTYTSASRTPTPCPIENSDTTQLDQTV